MPEQTPADFKFDVFISYSSKIATATGTVAATLPAECGKSGTIPKHKAKGHL